MVGRISRTTFLLLLLLPLLSRGGRSPRSGNLQLRIHEQKNLSLFARFLGETHPYSDPRVLKKIEPGWSVRRSVGCDGVPRS